MPARTNAVNVNRKRHDSNSDLVAEDEGETRRQYGNAYARLSTRNIGERLQLGLQHIFEPLQTAQLDEQVVTLGARSAGNLLAYGPLAHGLLGGTVTTATAFGPGDWRAHSLAFTGAGLVSTNSISTSGCTA